MDTKNKTPMSKKKSLGMGFGMGLVIAAIAGIAVYASSPHTPVEKACAALHDHWGGPTDQLRLDLADAERKGITWQQLSAECAGDWSRATQQVSNAG